MKVLVSDELWSRVEPLLPPLEVRRFRFPGRKELSEINFPDWLFWHVVSW